MALEELVPLSKIKMKRVSTQLKETPSENYNFTKLDCRILYNSELSDIAVDILKTGFILKLIIENENTLYLEMLD